MQTNDKPFYKTVRFWQIIVIGAVLLALVIGILVGLKDAVVVEQPPETTLAPTEATTEPTVPATYPPPPENPYGPADFYYEGTYLTCAAGEAVLGIDVSTWQGEIDWQQVKGAGIEYAIIRVGYRSTDLGNLAMDDYAKINYQGATDAGVKVGAYFFSQAITVEEAEEEARYVLAAVKDWRVDMPIVYDWEYVSDTARTADMDARLLTDCTKAFCSIIEDAGYDSMIYFNRDQSHKQMYLEELTDFGFWLAMYDRAMDYPYKIDMWQYSCTGFVPGIDGHVDMNLYFPYA